MARLDVDRGVLRRRGEMTGDDPVKRRGSRVLSSRFAKLARAWMKEDLAKGYTHVVHDWRGRPVGQLSRQSWIRILKDAQVPYWKLYALKDTAVQISRAERIRAHDAAERFSIREARMSKHYGADWDLGAQIDPAEAHGAQVNWRRAHEMAKQRMAEAEAAREAREATMPPPPPARRARKARKAGRRPSATDVRTLKVGAFKPAPKPTPAGDAPDAQA